MFKRLHLTPRQWKGLLKWTLYALFFLLVVVLQTVWFAKKPLFGIKPNLVPVVIVCVCLREGSERGGLFALLASLFWCLSGSDYGNLSVLLLTVCAVLSSVLCSYALANRFIPAALCCLGTLLIHETVILTFKYLLDRLLIENLWRVELPCVLLSMLAFPLIYVIVKAVGKTGGDYGV